MFLENLPLRTIFSVPIFSHLNQTSLNALPNLSRENRRQPSGLEKSLLSTSVPLPADLGVKTVRNQSSLLALPTEEALPCVQQRTQYPFHTASGHSGFASPTSLKLYLVYCLCKHRTVSDKVLGGPDSRREQETNVVTRNYSYSRYLGRPNCLIELASGWRS